MSIRNALCDRFDIAVADENICMPTRSDRCEIISERISDDKHGNVLCEATERRAQRDRDAPLEHEIRSTVLALLAHLRHRHLRAALARNLRAEPHGLGVIGGA